MKRETREVLKGVQHILAERMHAYAYRVKRSSGTSVLCDRHIEELRQAGEHVPLTGEMFEAELCDACLEEQKKENEI